MTAVARHCGLGRLCGGQQGAGGWADRTRAYAVLRLRQERGPALPSDAGVCSRSRRPSGSPLPPVLRLGLRYCVGAP